MPDKIDIYQDAAKEWRWRRISGNGRIVSGSGEGFVDESYAEESAMRYNSDLYETVKPFAFDAEFYQRIIDFSTGAFGPGNRESGVIDHIEKEFIEIRSAVSEHAKVSEWIDVIILGLDGAWRAGGAPQDILTGIANKVEINKRRTWPDWRTAPEGQAIEHDRSAE